MRLSSKLRQVISNNITLKVKMIVEDRDDAWCVKDPNGSALTLEDGLSLHEITGDDVQWFQSGGEPEEYRVTKRDDNLNYDTLNDWFPIPTPHKFFMTQKAADDWIERVEAGEETYGPDED